MALGMVAILSTAATVALVLSRASREAEIRKEIAAQIRQHAAAAARFQPKGAFVRGLEKAADIAEGPRATEPVSPGFATVDSSRRARPAGDWRRSS